jgi:hypothetical protein
MVLFNHLAVWCAWRDMVDVSSHTDLSVLR